MQFKKIILQSIVLGIVCTSCNSAKHDEVKTESQNVNLSNVPSENELSFDEIDNYRAEIESLPINPIEVSTENLREKIKQKWSKLHFYVRNGVVVKVKSYPYSEISKRTEEFYANGNGLLAVVVEDNGLGSKGKQKAEIDKLYYFSNGNPIKEVKKDNNESEYTIKQSDYEELISEFREYLDIYKALSVK